MRDSHDRNTLETSAPQEIDDMRAKLADLYQKAEDAWCRFIDQEERKRLH